MLMITDLSNTYAAAAFLLKIFSIVLKVEEFVQLTTKAVLIPSLAKTYVCTCKVHDHSGDERSRLKLPPGGFRTKDCMSQ
jgi:hypothetical protein